MNKKQKTLLVGLDSACWEYLNPLLLENKLPTIHRLMDTGAWGKMVSTMPPWTPTAWSSIITGKNPGKHGVFDMLSVPTDDYSFSLTNSKTRIGVPFWKRLNERDMRVGLINVPFTFPIEPLNGFVVCGFGTPYTARDIAYPSELQIWIEKYQDNFKPVVDPTVLWEGSPEEIYHAEKEHQASQVMIAAEMAQKYQVDVLAINLMFLDHANHRIPDMQQVNEAICQSDRDLKLLIEAFSPENIILISDHGSQRLKGNFLMQAWLRDQGFLTQTDRNYTERSLALNWILLQWFQVHKSWSGVPEKLVRRLTREILLKLPEAILHKILLALGKTIPFALEQVLFGEQPDYSQTKVFPGSIFSGLLYLNRNDRFKTGIVSTEQANLLLSDLTAKLLEIKDPETGEYLFSEVFEPHEIYEGPALVRSPDLILDNYKTPWNIQLSAYDSIVEKSRDKYFVSSRDYGRHSREGIFIFSGPAFKSGEVEESKFLADVPATLLYLHDVPIPEDYDGRVLTDLISDEFLEEHHLNFQAGDQEIYSDNISEFTDEDNKILYEQLRALGYM